MATLSELSNALKNADAAGDTEAAKKFADAIRQQQSTAQQVQTEEPGIMSSIADVFTGEQRATPETESMPDWATMPEMNEMSMSSFKSALGTMLTNPDETAQIIKSNFPDVQVRKDDKGNILMRSSINGREYAIKPGFQVSDIPRAIGGMLAFTPGS